MSHRSLSDAQEREVAALYQGGMTGPQLISKFNVSHRVIYGAIRRSGVQVRTTSQSRTGWMGTPEQVSDLIRLYTGGMSVHQVARHFRCRTDVVSVLLAENHVRLHPGGRVHPRLTAPQEWDVGSRYAAGESLAGLAKAFGVSVSTVCNVLRRQGVDARVPARPEFWTPEVVEQLKLLHAEGMSERQIGEHLGVSTAAVNRRLRVVGVINAAPRARGAAHGAWKGGRALSGEGYILVRCTDADRAYVRVNVSGYAPEHRLIAGRALGRKLLRSETVHHINGDKTDNRIENLQVRQGNHGTGVVFACRVCGSHDIMAVPLAE